MQIIKNNCIIVNNIFIVILDILMVHKKIN